ncbi:hypothetical protein LTR97_011243 [Elasticomyces elasticus]|uniref:Photolyase/cryptochrome alpha/beta domain-containing protein n=1 Tax=Elasticomyces elasticus TaxID=574655 RepID=A0AAN8A052_9PEZI|nr:hypothetical protein LTR97_011243 [Elasticomyces elasticus]
MSQKAGQKHARSDSQTHEDYEQVKRHLKHPSAKRGREIDADTPYDQLNKLLEKTRDVKPRNVLHWFRSKDLRQEDNKGLHAASKKAKEGDGNLITMYLYSPKDLEWHGTSPARSDFILDNLRIIKDQLDEKNIPFEIITAEGRGNKTDKVMEFAKQHDISHIYANMEYEVDELRRDIDLAKKLQDEKDMSLDILHDQTVVVPGSVRTGAGGPAKVFTHYYHSWLDLTKNDPSLFDTASPPEGNDKNAKKQLQKLFDAKIPELPETKQFTSNEERDGIRKLWPAGNEAGMKRLQDFLKHKITDYAANRSEAALDPSSRLSAYFSAGIVSVRQVLKETKDFNKGKDFAGGDAGVVAWVREIVFREFYRQVTVITPHTSMNLPQNIKFDNVKWEEDEEGWKKWCEGRTGVPFVDAGMRQINTEAYMHNRLRSTYTATLFYDFRACRQHDPHAVHRNFRFLVIELEHPLTNLMAVNTSSYLSGNMLIDYRFGERYFAEHLIDWDLSNNTQGWEPSYTIFNPVTQAEKHDKNGDFIRKWVPELRDVKGKAIFMPSERLSKAEFKKLGYPYPHCDFTETAQRAKARYKHDLAEAP